MARSVEIAFKSDGGDRVRQIKEDNEAAKREHEEQKPTPNINPNKR